MHVVTVSPEVPEETESNKAKVKKAQDALKSIVHFYVLQCCDAGVDVEHISLFGDNASELLCEHAATGSYHLMIMGSRGLGRLKSKLLGSVSAYCVRHSPIPVLIVRDD